MIVLDICLSDIPRERITTGKNGKKYCKLCVTEMRQPDNYGNSHTVYMSQTKEERAARAEKQWVGKGTLYEGQGGGGQQRQPDLPITRGGYVDNDLPF